MMRQRFRRLKRGFVTGASMLTAVLAIAGCAGRAPDVDDLPEVVDFNFHVKPILSDRCFTCHGPDDAARQAGLKLFTEEGMLAQLESGNRAVVPRRPGRSELVRRILSTDPRTMMPPPESHLSLSDYERAVLIRWIEQGAEWKPHWSFIPPTKPDPPTVGDEPRVRNEDEPRVRNEIDRFVLAALKERGLEPSHEADRETLIRRVSFDLTGLPPTVEEIDDFLADDSPDALEKVVDRLLASPAYGEHMAANWLDVARFADSHGYQDDGMRDMSPWRDWVIRAFNDNMTFDEFITWQLAGDLLPDPTQDQILATAFNRNHGQSQEGGIVSEEYRVEYVADRVNTLGAAFLGVTTECARCHDHKYDPVFQDEYYQLYAFFNNVNETGQIPYSGMPSPTVFVKDDATREELARLRDEIGLLEKRIAVENETFDDGFAAWLGNMADARAPIPVEPPGLIGHYPLDEMVEYAFVNTVDRSRPATLSGDRDHAPETVPGRFATAQRLVGDSYVNTGAGFAFFERNEPFSLSLWFNVETDGVEGPLVTKSGGLFNGNRGYEVILHPDGTLTAGLHHVFPDNSIEIRSLGTVTSGTWHHLAFTYDGSSRASGLRLFLDGESVPAKVTVDNLKASILHNSDGENWGGGNNLSLGKRFEETLEDVIVDEFRVYDRQLTPLEVRSLGAVEDPIGKALAVVAAGAGSRHDVVASEALQALREHYVLRVAPGLDSVRRQLRELRGRENEIMTALPQVMVMRERSEQRRTFVLERGAYDEPRQEVGPGTPEAIMPFPDDWPRNRLGLARWLVDPDQPLTARVLANRYWAMLFGNGIVRTMEDFGNQGSLPTHPELLDWLAVTFVESGWDLKALLRTIVTSATYRQSSVADAHLQFVDPANEWLARGPAYRLSAEQIRDNALAASGLLVRQIGGPSVYPYQPPGLWEELAIRNQITYEQATGDDLYRRSLYTVWKRSSPPPSMISFDAAERFICTVERHPTSTPLQSLVLLNDPQFVEAARVVAERMQQEAGPALDDRITHGFRLLTSRRPDAEDLGLLTRLYEEELAGFREEPGAAAALLRVGEHPRDQNLDPAETAALAVVASTIMNSDAAVFKR